MVSYDFFFGIYYGAKPMYILIELICRNVYFEFESLQG